MPYMVEMSSGGSFVFNKVFVKLVNINWEDKSIDALKIRQTSKK